MKKTKILALLAAMVMLFGATFTQAFASTNYMPDPFFENGISREGSVWTTFGNEAWIPISFLTPTDTGISANIALKEGVKGGIKATVNVPQDGYYMVSFYHYGSVADTMQVWPEVDGVAGKDKPMNPTKTWAISSVRFYITKGEHVISINAASHQPGNLFTLFYNPSLTLA